MVGFHSDVLSAGGIRTGICFRYSTWKGLCSVFFVGFFYRCRCENLPPAVTDTITCPRLGSFCSTCASPSYTESTARSSCSYTSLNELFLWQSACLSTGELSDLCSLTQKLLPTLLKQSPSSHTVYRRGPNTCWNCLACVVQSMVPLKINKSKI